jgi:carboxyl-terminal processing protease
LGRPSSQGSKKAPPQIIDAYKPDEVRDMKKLYQSLLIVSLLALSAPAGRVTSADPVRQADSNGVRDCLFIPGVSVPATIPPVNPPPPTPFPTPTPLPPTAVDADTTAVQLRVFQGLWNAVNDHYVYTDFRGHDWNAIGAKYQAMVQQGLSNDEFYAAMQAMISELGDEHSYFQSPAEIAAETARLQKGNDFVGIGALFNPVAGGDRAAVIVVFPDSPAADAGLRPHDVLLAVNGGPIRDAEGSSLTRGPAGTSVTLTIQRPGEPPHDVTLTRREVTGSLPIDTCVFPGTRIGYILFPTLLDKTIADQTREALREMTANGPLDGLILDNRVNGGGLGSVAQDIMSLFVSGLQGYYISRDGQQPLDLQPEDIGGSQTVPLVVLVSRDTVSYGEIVSGVLRVAGRAVVVGEPTLGNVEQLWSYDFEDGSRAWIASATFEPLGQANGIWEETGIIPDVNVPGQWDEFTEANDPGIAKALDLLMQN